MSFPTNSVGPTVEQRLDRLELALARLATEVDERYLQGEPRQSAEMLIEMILYPEHFLTATIK